MSDLAAVVLVVGALTVAGVLLLSLGWLIAEAHMATTRHERTHDDD